MKKITIILIVILLITGCGKNKNTTVEERHGKQNKEITESLKNLEFENEEKYFENLIILDSNTIRTELGIREERVENYIAAVSYERNGNYYIAIKPKKEWKEYVKSALDSYTELLKEAGTDENKSLLINSVNTEINGYYVYVSSKDNDKVLNILKAKLK